MEMIMIHIGTFKRTTDGYAGTIRTLTLYREVVLVPAGASDAADAPNYRVLAGDVEIGAAWKQAGENAGDYVSLLIDDPWLAHPIRADLFHFDPDSDTFHLSWSRPQLPNQRS
jgi:uncharacterized protein (DUF736 family)